MPRMSSLATMSEPRRALLVALKGSGSSRIDDLAGKISVSYEGTRQHLRQLESEGWITRHLERDSTPGRPRSLYRLSTAGDHLFPKAYEELAVTLIDAVGERLGAGAVRTLLEEMALQKVERWRPMVAGKSLPERLEIMRHIYQTYDPFCHVESSEDGSPQLVEMNCPYLEVAKRRPALCSVTVSVLRELLGRKVVRTERFQDGCGRCVFQVQPEEAAADDAPLFDWEPERAAAKPED